MDDGPTIVIGPTRKGARMNVAGRADGRLVEIARSSMAAGILATAAMDAAMVAAAVLDRQRFASEHLDPRIIGRWAAGLLQGRWRHDDITAESPVRGELLLGMATHYAIGTALTTAWLAAGGRRAGIGGAVGYGVATSVLPLFVLFPSLGYGPLGRRSGEGGRLFGAMLTGHVAFGFGIGACAR
jgi:hypothetical protein